MVEITSKDNEKIKSTKLLLKSKNRNKESKFIIEGYRILTLAFEQKDIIDYVFINEDFENKEELSEYLFPYMHKDCMLLVKGSRGMKLDELVNVLIEKNKK